MLYPSVAGVGNIFLALTFLSGMVGRRAGSFRKKDQLELLERRGVLRGKITLQAKKAGIVIPICHFSHFSFKVKGWGKGNVSFCLVLGRRNVWKEVHAVQGLFAHPALPISPAWTGEYMSLTLPQGNGSITGMSYQLHFTS